MAETSHDIVELLQHIGNNTAGGIVGGSSSSTTDGATFTEGTDSIVPIGGEAVTGTPTAATNGKATIGAYTLRRANHVNLRNNAGVELGTTANPLIYAPAAQVFTHTGEQRLTLIGAAQSAIIPATTTRVRLCAEGGDLRWTLSGSASATSAGYLPQGSIEYLCLSSASTLSIYGSTGTFANLYYGKMV